MRSAITTFSSFPATSSAIQVRVLRNIAGNIHPKRRVKRARLSLVSESRIADYGRIIHTKGRILHSTHLLEWYCPPSSRGPYRHVSPSNVDLPKNFALRKPRCGVENDSPQQQITK
jgi:hypothetical protein